MSSHDTSPRHIRVFLSSPGDVREERDLAIKVIEKLPYDPVLRGRFSVEVVAWEKPGVPMIAPLDPQTSVNEALPKPSECDIVIVIFWKRMGTPLSEKYVKPEAHRYSFGGDRLPTGPPLPDWRFFSGTEWEYFDALEAAQDTGLPLIVVYRRTEKVRFDLSKSDFMQRLEQWQRVEELFRSYANPAEFQRHLENHLKSLIRRLLEDGSPATATQEDRRLDAAMPQEGTVGQPTEAWVQICVEGSDGFKAKLPEIAPDASALSKQDVRDSNLTVAFPVDARTGKPVPLKITVELDAPDFTAAAPSQDTILYPQKDSALLTFSLTPTTDRARSIVHVKVWATTPGGERVEVAAAALYMRVHPVGVKRAAQVAWAVVSLPLMAIVPRERDERPRAELGLALPALPTLTKPRKRVQRILPGPFEWIDIPAGRVTLTTEKSWYANYIPEGQSRTFDVPASTIAKYPITNAQYAKFIDAGGYRVRRWWTDAGWQARKERNWTEPRDWEGKQYDRADHPVTGVSWYEALAFCQWLSEVGGEDVLLPTEQQWQRAAQGGDGREYPWGNRFDASRCNTRESGIGTTTPVTRYPNGASPFGVMDMVGNVWEWCSTAYETGNTEPEGTPRRVLRGGSFVNDLDLARAVYRYDGDPP